MSSQVGGIKFLKGKNNCMTQVFNHDWTLQTSGFNFKAISFSCEKMKM